MESLRYIGNHRAGPDVKTIMRRLIVIFFAALAVGCGSEGGDQNGHAPGPGPDGLLLEVERPEVLPVALHADGRFFTAAPQIAIYPAPALPAFSVVRIPPESAADILTRVQRSGVLDAESGGQVVVTAVIDGERRVTRLGTEDAEKVDAALADLPVSSGDRLYEAQGLAVFVGPVQEPTEGIEPEIRDWPLAGALPATGCVLVTGAELEPVLAAAQQANQLTRWRSAGALVGLTFRPLLPHEGSCDDVAAPSA